MSGHHPTGPGGLRGLLDTLRKALIVVLLIGAMLGLHQFARPAEDFDPRGLLALGFLILAAYTVGELAVAVRIPHITGYLLAGIVFGPSIARVLQVVVPPDWLLPPLNEGILSERVLHQLGLVDALALALIALSAGGELKLSELRQSFRHVLSITLGMVFTVMILVTLYIALISAVAPALMPVFAGLPFDAMLSLALVLATLATATSPAVAIAVINSTGARGPVATIVLTGVVVGQITVVLLFSASSSVALGQLGGTGSISVLQSLGQVGTSIGVGVLVGIGIALYLRYVGAEMLLFLVGIIYATSFALDRLHGEGAVAFIAAGLVVGNFSSGGPTLIREVERLSRPTYVVFFALAGAKLHLDVLWLMLLPALGLFLVRVAGVYAGSLLGARLSHAPPAVQQFAWTGFVSQAGLAIALALQAQVVLPPEIGGAIFSMSIAVISIAELVGPLALQTGLNRAGEIGGMEAPQTAQEGDDPPPPQVTRKEVEPWLFVAPIEPWGHRIPTGGASLDEAVDKLQADLTALVRDKVELPARQRQEEMEQWLRQLRREWLRTLRRAVARLSERDRDHAMLLREDVGQLAARWRELVLELQDRPALSEAAAPLSLIEALDQKAASQRRWLEAGIPESVLEPRPERAWRKLRRSLLRLRERFWPRRRTVDLLELSRYHLSGELPGQLEAHATVLLRGDLHLSAWVVSLFQRLAEDFETAALLAEQARRKKDSGQDEEHDEFGEYDDFEQLSELEELRAHLIANRSRFDPLFQLAAADMAAIARSSASTAEEAVGRALSAIRCDAAVMSTLDLSPSQRRYGRVFTERNRGLQAVTQALRYGKQTVTVRQAQVALELELVGLEARVRAVVRERGHALERELLGKGPRQLLWVGEGLAEWLERIGRHLEQPGTAGSLSRQLRREAEPLLQRIREARSATDSLMKVLSDEQWVTGLVETLSGRALELSESYTVPTEPLSVPAKAVPTAEIAFRELVSAFVETRVARDLLDVTDDLASRVREMAAALEEVERVTTFNVELSCAELDVLDEASAVSTETVEIVRAMVIGAVGRSQHRLVRLTESARALLEQTEQRICDTVLGQFESLRTLILGGAVGELRTVWLRDVRMGQLARRAEAWGGWLPGLWARSAALGHSALGEERIEALRATLGLRPTEEQRDQRTAFAPPEPSVQVPIVYRRLFSDLPLDTADMLAGRQSELERLRMALSDGPLRVAAVVGVDLQSAAGLAHAVVRGDFAGVLRLDARAPADVEVVEEWLERVQAVQRHAIVVEGLHWLFERRPGGAAPLQRLLDGMLQGGDRNAWLIVSDSAVWRCASQAAPLYEIAGAVVELAPLSVDELEREVLARHAMSGYAVEFDADDDLGWQVQHVMLRGEDRERRRRRAWFRTLHAASNGILQDALRLWMASIREVDDQQERVRIGTVPRPPLTRLSQLPEEVQLTLFETSRQGWINAPQHARLFRTTEQAARAHLGALTHLGLLVAEGEVLRIAPHLRGPVYRVLSYRRWT